ATAAAQALSGASGIVANADVAAAYFSFLQANLSPSMGAVIATNANPATPPQTALAAGTNLMNRSVYGDSRGIEAVQAVVAVALGGGTASARLADAQNAASAYADLANEYQRFIAGKMFGDMITATADAAARAAT